MTRMNWNRPKRHHGTSDGFNPLAARADRAERAWGNRSLEREAARIGRQQAPALVLNSASIMAAQERLTAVTNAVVHCDGACEPNPGPGGWGLLIDSHAVHRIELCGGDPATTNNRMEVTAAIVALTVLPVRCATVVITDSQYLAKGASAWIAGWRRKGFKRGDQDMPNADLWRLLDTLITGRSINWKWVRGHDGHHGNERADQLAAIGLRQSGAGS